MRIAVIGANGQVGAEVCLRLAGAPGVTLVPIVRNRGGSAFLRSQGVACRHGSVADPGQAPRLLGDCDVVANFALAGGAPHQARTANRSVIENTTAFSRPDARMIYFSTMSVYRRLESNRPFAMRGAYGKEKLTCEAESVRQGRQHGKEVYVLRLGHVTGELQGISQQMRDAIARGALSAPDPDRASNTIHVASIADAILSVAKGRESPGTYDLFNVPQWTWREALAHEAARAGASLSLGTTEERARGSILLRSLAGALMRSERVRSLAIPMVARLSPALGDRVQSVYYKRRAAAEIASLGEGAATLDAFRFNAVGSRYLKSLTRTADLLSDDHAAPARDRQPWPTDLPDAFVTGDAASPAFTPAVAS